MTTLENKLRNYILAPKNPEYNFQLAREYEITYHTASAAGYYLRVAELSRDDTLTYEALLRMALCFRAQGNRVFTVTGLLMRAISLLPNRPEAYFLLSRTYEQNKDWQEAYTWSIIGEKVADVNRLLRVDSDPLSTDVQYPGKYGFLFERAVASWWLGLYDECLHLFRVLRDDSNVDLDHAISVRQNLGTLDNVWKPPMLYTAQNHERLKVKFTGSESIEKNFSQCYQDLFVLTMLDGMRNGTFLEIGCGDAWYGSNTALLEKMGWRGTSVDIVPETVSNFKKQRKSNVVLGDATTMDFEQYLVDDIDYLQIDCDPAMTSLQALLNIPFHNHRFAVITFEHDHYLDESKSVRERSRAYLRSLGYVLVIGDVSVNPFDSFEDWWVHPSLISEMYIPERIAHFNQYNSDPNQIDKCMFH